MLDTDWLSGCDHVLRADLIVIVILKCVQSILPDLREWAPDLQCVLLVRLAGFKVDFGTTFQYNA